MGNDSISNALQALLDNVDKSNLSESGKNAMQNLLERLSYYYIERCVELNKNASIHRLLHLYSRMTDYIVTINDTLKGKNDVFCVTNAIYKEINYDEEKGVFKRKRLI